MDPLTEPLIMFPNEAMERADLTAEYVDLEIDRARPGSWRDWWPTPTMTVSTVEPGSRPRERATAPCVMAAAFMVVRDEILPHVQNVVGDSCETLPLRSDDGDFWAIHPVEVLDALDLERCEGLHWDEDETGPYIWMYDKLAWRHEVVRWIFERGETPWLQRP